MRSTGRLMAAMVMLAASLAPVATGQAQEDSYPWVMEEVAPGVFAALQPSETRFGDSNSAVIIGLNEVVVIDSQADPAAVRALIAWIGAATDAPVGLVINTHWHGDHTQGNAIYRDVYGDDLEIIGHASLVEDVPERAGAFVRERTAYFATELPAAYQRLEQGVFRDGSTMTEADKEEQQAVLARAELWLAANRDARFVGPNRTYSSRQRLRRAGRTIDLVHYAGHTRGDTVVWLPEEGVAITGDLLDDLPYVGHGYPTSWRTALDSLRDMPIVSTIPGHGPVFRDDTKLNAVHGFLDALITQATAAAAAGQTLEDAIATITLESWRDRLASDDIAARFFEQSLGEAVERAWLEARDELEQ